MDESNRSVGRMMPFCDDQPHSAWTCQDHRRAAQLEAEDSLTEQMMQLQYSADEDTAQEERSASAPPLRSSIDHILQGLGPPEDTHTFMQRQQRPMPPGAGRRKAEAHKQRLSLNGVQGRGIAKKATTKRRVNLNDPHERARQADLAAARYAVSTWEDILRFKVKAATTKARHEAWEAKPAAWDLVLASSFSAMGAA